MNPELDLVAQILAESIHEINIYLVAQILMNPDLDLVVQILAGQANIQNKESLEIK